MGPIDHLETDSAKLFAAFYALYSGAAFLAFLVYYLRLYTTVSFINFILTWRILRMIIKQGIAVVVP